MQSTPQVVQHSMHAGQGIRWITRTADAGIGARAACLRKLTQLAAGTAGEGLNEVFSDYVGAVLNSALL